MLVDVRAEPRHLGRPAAALVDERVVVDAGTGGDEPRRLGELVGVAALLRHGDRDAVRCEDERRSRPSLGRDPGKRVPDARDVRLDEAGVVVERAQLEDLRCVRPDGGLRVVEVLAVLPAARVRAERRGEERERAPDARVAQLADRVPEERVPVAVAEEDRQVDPVCRELGLERGDQLAVLGVERADPVEQLVVVRDLLEPFPRDVPSARDVLEERQHVVHPFRPAERHDEQCVERPVVGAGVRAVGRLLARLDRHRVQRTRRVTCRRPRTGALEQLRSRARGSVARAAANGR